MVAPRIAIGFTCGGAGISIEPKALVSPRKAANRIRGASTGSMRGRADAQRLFMVLRTLVACAAVAVEIALWLRRFVAVLFLAALFRFADILQTLGQSFLHERFALRGVGLPRFHIRGPIE